MFANGMPRTYSKAKATEAKTKAMALRTNAKDDLFCAQWNVVFSEADSPQNCLFH